MLKTSRHHFILFLCVMFFVNWIGQNLNLMQTSKLHHLSVSKILGVLIGFFLSFSLAHIGNTQSFDSAALQSALDSVYNDTQNNNWQAGLSAAVRWQGQKWTGVQGYANIDSNTKIQTNHHFRIYSSTKTFTAALILDLMSEGKLSLSDSLYEHVSAITNPNIDTNVTVRQLLEHATGFHNYVDDEDVLMDVVANPTKIWEPLEVMNDTDYVEEPNFPAGTQKDYSSTNYILLGLVAENALASDSVELAFKNRFFDPLGLNDSYFPPAIPVQGPMPSPHDDLSDFNLDTSDKIQTTQIPLEGVGSIAWTTGGIIATASDLSKWATKLYTGQATSDEALDTMYRSLRGAVDDGDPGYGIFRDEATGTHVVGHGGAAPGYRSITAHDTLHDISIAVCTNQGEGDLDHVSNALLNVVLAEDTTSISNKPQAPNLLSVSIPSPNPASNHMRYTLQLAQPQDDVKSVLYDMQGRLIKRTEHGRLPKGHKSLTMSTRDISPGKYFLRIETESTMKVRKVMVAE